MTTNHETKVEPRGAANQIRVKCDATGCGWSEMVEIGEAKKYHNAPCPKCGAHPVLSDDDMLILVHIAGLAAMGLAAIHTLDEGQPLPDGYIHLDTSDLRK